MKKITILLAFACAQSFAQNIYTVAGNGNGYFQADNVLATSTGMAPTGAVAFDAAGNMYIPDMNDHRIRKVDYLTGIITTVAGTGTGGYNGDGILAVNAQLYNPDAVAIDTAGNIYIGDYSNNRIRKVDASTGLISTIAGTGTYGFNGDNILAVNAQLTEVSAITVDRNGNIFFCEFGNQRVRRIDASTGIITTVAGNGTSGYNGDGGLADTTWLNSPNGIALDTAGNIYISDWQNSRIRKVDISTGIMTTVAGSTYNTYNGDGGPATSATFRWVWGVALDSAGNIYVDDQVNNMIHKVDHITGIITTVAGNGTGGFSGDGGPATSAELDDPRGIAVDPCGNLYITIYYSRRIRQVTSYLVSTTVNNVSCNNACDGSVMATASGGNSPYLYSWSGGLGNGASHTNVCANNYTVFVTDLNGCMEKIPVPVTEPTAISITITPTNATCIGNGSASASISGGTSPYTYSWSNGATTSNITGIGAGTYILTVTDAGNCTNSDTVTIINNPNPFPSAPICMVTVDSLSQNNIIMWDKTPYTNIDSFIVYREISTNIYKRIGAVPYSALSELVDTVRTQYFPNTGDPNTGTYRYKIAMRDTCGGISLLSPYHNTIYIINNNGTFSWPQLYSIENASNPVVNYVLYRDNNSNGNWLPINSVAGTQQTVTDPNYAQYVGTARWRVQTVWNISCTPTQMRIDPSVLSAYNSSFSDQDDGSTPVTEYSISSAVSVFPSASNGTFTVSTSGLKNVTVQLYSPLGEMVFSTELSKEKTELNIPGLANGVYLLRFTSGKGVAVKKIVIE